MTIAHVRPPPAGPDVVALVTDGLCAFEFACAAEVFGLPRPELGPHWYRFASCSIDGAPVRGPHGMTVRVDGGLERLSTAGTVVVPGWPDPDAPVPEAVVRALIDAHGRGARLLSICSGAFALAATGLLDGARATTHWRYAEALARRHPAVDVDADVLYVEARGVLTSAGSAAGLDLCLHLVRTDHGADVAGHVARRLVVPPHREGGQAQRVERAVDAHGDGSLAPLLDELQVRLAEPLRVAALARRAGTSERTFLRRFRAATGTTPGHWIASARVDAARGLLETTALSVERIAERVGLGTAATLRHHFRRRVGIGPSAYRRQFSERPGRGRPRTRAGDGPGGAPDASAPREAQQHRPRDRDERRAELREIEPLLQPQRADTWVRSPRRWPAIRNSW